MSPQEGGGQIRFCLAWMRILLHVVGCLKRSDSSGVCVAGAELQMQELMSALGPDVGSVCPSATSSAGQQHGIKRIFWVFECPGINHIANPSWHWWGLFPISALPKHHCFPMPNSLFNFQSSLLYGNFPALCLCVSPVFWCISRRRLYPVSLDSAKTIQPTCTLHSQNSFSLPLWLFSAIVLVFTPLLKM